MLLKSLWNKFGPVTRVTSTHEGIIECARFGLTNIQVNTSACLFRVGDTVIDTSCPNRWNAVKQYLKQAADPGNRDVSGQLPVKQVLISHHHEDHAGNGKAIQEELALPVYAPEKCIPLLKKKDTIQLYRRILWGSREPFEAHLLPQQGTIATIVENEKEKPISVIPVYTPGHCSDHYCFWIPEKKWLFTSDLFVHTRQDVAREEEDLVQQMHSLKYVLDELDFEEMFCTHKGIIGEKSHSLLEQKYNNFRELQKEIGRMYTDDPSLKTRPEDIAKTLLGNAPLITYFTCGHFKTVHTVKQFLSPYSYYKEAQQRIGAISPEHALRYLESGSIRGPGAEPATLLSNESWLRKHQLRIDHSAKDADMAVAPGMGKPLLNKSRIGTEESPKFREYVAPSRMAASNIRAKTLLEQKTQHEAPAFTVRDAEQTVRSAHAQYAVFPQEQLEPTWVVKQFGGSQPSKRVLMPDLSMRTPVEALMSMKALQEHQQNVRNEALGIAQAAAASGEHVAALSPPSKDQQQIDDVTAEPLKGQGSSKYGRKK